MPSIKTFNNRIANDKLGINSYLPPWNIEDTQFSDILNFRCRQALINQVAPKTPFVNLYAVNTPSNGVVEYTPPSDSTSYAGYNNYLLSVYAGPTQAVSAGVYSFQLNGTITGNILSNPDYQQRWNALEYPSLATIIYDNQDSLTPNVTVSEPGVYTFRLFAASPVTGIWAWSKVSVYVQVAAPTIYTLEYTEPAIHNTSGTVIPSLSLDGQASFRPTNGQNYSFLSSILISVSGPTGTISEGDFGAVSSYFVALTGIPGKAFTAVYSASGNVSAGEVYFQSGTSGAPFEGTFSGVFNTTTSPVVTTGTSSLTMFAGGRDRTATVVSLSHSALYTYA